MKVPFIKPSTKSFWDEGRKTEGYSLADFLHGYFYGRFTYFYIGVGKGKHPATKWLAPIWAFISRFIKKPEGSEANRGKINLADGYHGKAIPLETATQLVQINEEIKLPDLEQVIPYKRARAIVMKNPEHIVALDCPCRVAMENPCLPLDVCLVVGDPFASFILDHHPDRSRRITRDEAVEILKAEDARGHVHHAFFKDVMLERFYAICNCCECCCGAMNAHKTGVPMLASSGYLAQIDEELCIACDSCADYCQFGAMEMGEWMMMVDREKCMGCGVCTGKCTQDAITLVADAEKGIPLEICSLLESVPV